MELENTLQLPDIWQQEAVRALKAGQDVVVDAPTGAGKTFIFEMMVKERLDGQLIYTVPTRALANDKLYEWRAKGWHVGITTGDLSDKPNAPIVVATLETQRRGILHGKGPRMLIVDEYQMLGDPVRGSAYELILALAPLETQLLLLSGSTGNPDEIQQWLQRNGRDVVLIRKRERPVPLEEVFFDGLRARPPKKIRNFWSKQIYKALDADLGPILIFAPKRLAAEQLAHQLAQDLDPEFPLHLSEAQKQLAGNELRKLLRSRVCYHHSGLSYAQRAGVIEPLAKAGQIQVIVATTGLGAGINFSMRCVFLMDREYRALEEHRQLRPDELLQMFGRAGRRGLDQKGFILVAPNKPRLQEARSMKLRRGNQVDWPSLIALMDVAVEQEKCPVEATAHLTTNLFSEQRIPLGLRDFIANPPDSRKDQNFENETKPSGQEVIEILNSQNTWERRKPKSRVPLYKAHILEDKKWVPALQLPTSLSAIKCGNLCKLPEKEKKTYGRELPIAKIVEEEKQDGLELLKSFHRRVHNYFKENEIKGKPPPKQLTRKQLQNRIVPLLPKLTQGGRISDFVEKNGILTARLDYSEAPVLAWQDSHGFAMLNPPTRKRSADIPDAYKEFLPNKTEQQDQKLETPAEIWFSLGLIDQKAHPTRRGILFSYYQHGEGLAIAAALEDPTYAIDDLVWHLANLRAGHRFERYVSSSARLGLICKETYHRATYSGYLRRGFPPHYGEGAAEVLQALEGQPDKTRDYIDDDLRPGDIERTTIEWRSILRQTAYAPPYEWERWQDLQKAARKLISRQKNERLLENLPPLTPDQRLRYEPQRID